MLRNVLPHPKPLQDYSRCKPLALDIILPRLRHESSGVQPAPKQGFFVGLLYFLRQSVRSGLLLWW